MSPNLEAGTPELENCRIVLVRPKIAANVGAAARVMRNFGLRDLTLVAPEMELSDPRGRLLATHAAEILDRARVVSTLDEALADCLFVAGTSARAGGPFRRQSVGLPEEVLPRLAARLAQGPSTLVFGPERSGLTDDEVTRCHFLVRIPTHPQHPALNLAQAVAVVLYELWRCASLPRQEATQPPGDCSTAHFADQEHLFHQLRSALEAIHFVYGPKGDALFHGLRHLLGKAELTTMEVDLLRGLARQIHWYVANHRPKEHPP